MWPGPRNAQSSPFLAETEWQKVAKAKVYITLNKAHNGIQSQRGAGQWATGRGRLGRPFWWVRMDSGKEAIKHKLSAMAEQSSRAKCPTQAKTTHSNRQQHTQTQTANLPRVFAGQVKQNELRIMKQYTKHKPKHLLHFPPPSSTFLYKCGKSLQGKKWPFWRVFPPQVSSVKIYAKLSATAKPKWAERVSLSWCCLVCTCENFSLAIRNYFINNFNCKSLGISFLRLQWAEPSWAESNSTLHFLIVAGQVLRSFISLNVIIVLVTKLADKCLPMGE